MSRTTCHVAARTRQQDHKGLAWLFGAFVICPCHLPITLAVLTGALSGSVAGTLVIGHPYFAGGLIVVAWLAATWRGIVLLNAPKVQGSTFNVQSSSSSEDRKF